MFGGGWCLGSTEMGRLGVESIDRRVRLSACDTLYFDFTYDAYESPMRRVLNTELAFPLDHHSHRPGVSSLPSSPHTEIKVAGSTSARADSLCFLLKINSTYDWILDVFGMRTSFRYCVG